MSPHAPGSKRLHDAVRRRQRGAERGEHEREPSIAHHLAMIGSLGWLVVVPTIGGVFLGRWLDGHLGTGIMMTAALLLAGLVAGCMLAWQRMHHP